MNYQFWEKKRRTRISPCPEYSLLYTDKSSGKSLMSFSLFPSINAFSISMESSAPVSFTAFTSSYRAKWYMQSMSPVPMPMRQVCSAAAPRLPPRYEADVPFCFGSDSRLPFCCSGHDRFASSFGWEMGRAVQKSGQSLPVFFTLISAAKQLNYQRSQSDCSVLRP